MFNSQPQKNKIFLSAVFLLIGLGIFNLDLDTTNAYLSDTATVSGITFQAAILNFQLTNNNLEAKIGPEALGEITHTSVAMPTEGSLPIQYTVTNSITEEDSGFCGKLKVEAKLNGVSKYSGPFSEMNLTSSTTEFGSWEFRFDLPPMAEAAEGDVCRAEAVFKAWRADTPDPAESGFTAEEKITFNLTARMVVLNEIFAKPKVDGVAPKDKEYIELYNNGSTAVDVLGWQISELAGTTEEFYSVVASGATASQMEPYGGASTIISAGGFLTLRFGGSANHLNDTGDLVKLYDNQTTLLDSHRYASVSAGKAVVRFPDGIGYWVDPEPTPGETNQVSMADLVAAGFDEETIAQILELAEMKDVEVLPSQVEEEIIPQSEATTTQPIASSTAQTLLSETGTTTLETEITSTTSPEVSSENTGPSLLAPVEKPEVAKLEEPAIVETETALTPEPVTPPETIQEEPTVEEKVETSVEPEPEAKPADEVAPIN